MSTNEDIVARAAFPESNALGVVFNGNANPMTVTVFNNGKETKSLVSLAASWHDTDKYWKTIKNQTAVKFNAPLEPGGNLTAPFEVYSEFRPKDLGLTVWADFKQGKEFTRVIAFNETVSIVEPAVSWFDPQVIFAYLVFSAALLGGAYAIYTNFIAKPVPKKRRAAPAPAVTVVQEKAGYEDDWIPAIHKKAQRGVSTPGSGTEATSGGESGPEGRTRRRKARK